MKSLLTLLTASLVASVSVAQNGPVHPLKVGDRMPDIEIHNLINYPVTVTTTADLKGSAILLDFCNVSCGLCTEMLPRLEAMQKQFGTKLSIFRITRNTVEQVRGLAKFSPLAASSRLPVATSDTSFIKLFPIKLPHHVWIDSDGIIKAITDSRNSTPDNIARLVEGNAPVVPPVYLFENFDNSKPLFADQQIGLADYTRFYSVFTGYINGINFKTGTGKDPVSGKIIRRSFYNMPASILLKFAWGGFGTNNVYGLPSDDRRLIFEVADKSRFVKPSDPSMVVDWEWRNSFCYEVQVPPGSENILQSRMQNNLQTYLDVDVKPEKRKIMGLALVKTTQGNKLISGSGNMLSTYNRNTETYDLQNVTTEKLAATLSSMLWPMLINDSTGIAGGISLKIKKSGRIKELREQLADYGLGLAEKEIEVDMLIVRDRKAAP